VSDDQPEETGGWPDFAPAFAGLRRRFDQLVVPAAGGMAKLRNPDRTLVQHFEALTGVVAGMDAVWGGLHGDGLLGFPDAGAGSEEPELTEDVCMRLYADGMLTYEVCEHICNTVPEEPYASDDPTSTYPVLAAALVRIAAKCRAPFGYDITTRLGGAIGGLAGRSPAAFDAAVDQILVLAEVDALNGSTLPDIWEALYGPPDHSYSWEHDEVLECVTTVYGPSAALDEFCDELLSRRQCLAGGIVDPPAYGLCAWEVVVDWLTARSGALLDRPYWSAGASGGPAAGVEITYRAPLYVATGCWRTLSRMFPELVFVTVVEGPDGSSMVVMRHGATIHDGHRDDKLVYELLAAGG